MNEFELFTKEVIEIYTQKKANGDLHSKLEKPSPANLRDYILIILARGLNQDDIQVLYDFFDPTANYVDLERAIKKIELAKLRPLQNFILGQVSTRDENIVKLLAILIKFEPRPYSLWKQQRLSAIAKPEDIPIEENGQTGKLEDQQESPLIPISPVKMESVPTSSSTETEQANDANISCAPIDNEPKKPHKHHPAILSHRQAIYFLGLVVLTIALLATLAPPKQCMYWQDDRYIATHCDSKIPASKVIARDDYILEHFQKITRPDTLSIEHASKVWYSKINNKVTFFTSPGLGHHPVQHDRFLRVATEDIIVKYAGPNSQRE